MIPKISPLGKSKLISEPSSHTFKSFADRTTSSDLELGGVDLISFAVDIFLSPVIKLRRFFSVISSPAKTPTSNPSLITVARSLILTNSAIRCVTIKMAAP